jgi:hypothetical protein
VRAALLVIAGTLSCGGAQRDSVPESHDVVVRQGAAPSAGGPSTDQGYEYVARRPLAVVALAEARGIDPTAAHTAVDRLADRLDACVTEQGRAGALPHGAARVIGQLDADGKVNGVNVRSDPGAGVATTAVLCLGAPARLLTFEPGAAQGRGFAIEAMWGPLVR